MRKAVAAITINGCKTALKIGESLNADIYIKEEIFYDIYDKNKEDIWNNYKYKSNGIQTFTCGIKELAQKLFSQYEGIIFVMSCGIVVRSIAPLLKSKTCDPAVIAVDELGRNVISLVSGHIGGANELAKQTAEILKGRAVITTATDILKKPAFDVLAEKNNCTIKNLEVLKYISSDVVNGKKVFLYSDYEIKGKIPDCLIISEENNFTRGIPLNGVAITNNNANNNTNNNTNNNINGSTGSNINNDIDNNNYNNNYNNNNLNGNNGLEDNKKILSLIPRDVVIGMGCKKGTNTESISFALEDFCGKNNISLDRIKCVASIDIKKDEPGLKALCKNLKVPFLTFTAKRLKNYEDMTECSDFVYKTTGVGNVCETSAISACGEKFKKIIGGKTLYKGITIAAALLKYEFNFDGINPGISIVGIGPGTPAQMTFEACEKLEQADLIVGYKRYVDILKEHFPHKKYFVSGMKKEVDRCKTALKKALEGNRVCVVSSGDAGVYGMAGLIYQLAENIVPNTVGELKIETIPGITSALSCAAVLGAPLTHDFAVISLSDLLTPWEIIEKRVRCAAMSDFIICIYNPKSKGRPKNIEKVRDIILEYQHKDIPAGIVWNAGRDEQRSVICSIGTMLDYDIDMSSTVVVGNSSTRIIKGRMVTPRGYEKYFKS